MRRKETRLMLRDLETYKCQKYVDVFYEYFIEAEKPSELNKRGRGIYRIRVYDRQVVIISDIGLGYPLRGCLKSQIRYKLSF